MVPASLKLTVLSLRYSSWSMRPWLVLTHVGAQFDTETVSLPHMKDPTTTTSMAERRQLGSIHGLFPVLSVKENEKGSVVGIHESLAICEYVAELYPNAHLWPDDPLDRARARAICCEMVSGFPHLRRECSCHLFARVKAFTPSSETQVDIERVFEIWTECLERSAGPYLFGKYFGIADAMFFPVLSRFRTYGIELPNQLQDYAEAIETTPAVVQLVIKAKMEPNITIYDDYIRSLGGDPNIVETQLK